MNLRRAILGTGNAAGGAVALVGMVLDTGLAMYGKQIESQASKYQADLDQRALQLAVDRQKAEARQLLAASAAAANAQAPATIYEDKTNFAIVAAIGLAAFLLIKR